MSNKTNDFLSYQQPFLAIFFDKNHLFYLLCSTLFWCFVVGVSWIRFYHSNSDDIRFFHEINFQFLNVQIILSCGFIFVLCILLAAFLTLPAILCKNILNYIISIKRSKYKSVFHLTGLAQYLPYVLLVVVNGGFYYISISTEIYHSSFYNAKLKKIEKNYEYIGKKNPRGYYVFMVPSYLLENSQKLSKIKSILPFQGKLFLESSLKPEIISQLIQHESDNVVQYYAPVPITESIQTFVPPTTLLIGIDRKNTPLFLNLFAINLVEEKRFFLTKKTFFSNRAMAFLKPMQFVFKSNIIGLFNPNWGWGNIGNTSLDLLLKYSTKLRKKILPQYNFVFLSDLEENVQNDLLIGSTDLVDEKNLFEFEKKLDLNLYTVVKTLLNVGAKNIALLPYDTSQKTFKVSNFFTSILISGGLKSYRTFFIDASDSFMCKPQSVYNYNKIINFNNNTLVNNMKFSKKGLPYLNFEYTVFIKNFFSSALYCYEQDRNIYILNRKELQDNFQSDITSENNFDIYKIDQQQVSYLLSEKEKNTFIDIYKHEIFK